MPSYPVNIRTCQHIKVNGTLCGSPALRDQKHCYYHMEWRRNNAEMNLNVKTRTGARRTIKLPSLEDANSVHATLAEIMRLLATNQIEQRAATLMLYALQIASANLRMTSFEPTSGLRPRIPE